MFWHTADSNDVRRAETLRENRPDLNIVTPLIERGITKAGCPAMIQKRWNRTAAGVCGWDSQRQLHTMLQGSKPGILGACSPAVPRRV